MAREYTIATRQSPLAMAQTRLAEALLRQKIAGAEFRIEKMVTTGDKRREWSLQEKGGKGLFTKELEDALLDGRADIAVHSAKDLPSEMPEGLAIAGYLPREDCADVLVRRVGVEAPQRIATGSPRRRIQLRYLFPTAEFAEIRGNVDTRLNKIAAGEADASALAAAGLNRLGIASWPGVEFQRLDLDQCVPAVGQAAVAIQCRSEDVDTFRPCLDQAAYWAVTLERAFLQRLGGGCQVAFAVNYVDGVLRVFHRQCGFQRFTLPLEYVAAKPQQIAVGLIRQLELDETLT